MVIKHALLLTLPTRQTMHSINPRFYNEKANRRSSGVSVTSTEQTPPLKRFRFLYSKLWSQHSESTQTASGTSSSSERINRQLDNLFTDFIDHIRQSEGVDNDNALKFWAQQRHVYTELADLAQDLIACPASQAYVERVFSICGMLLQVVEIAWTSPCKCVPV